ncbi:MAG: ATP-binding protein [Xanthomonadales bacterium]|jgi:signal transduction histidine kinase|nr:ATP-binding protein [Xanthomonadales bacterium]
MKSDTHPPDDRSRRAPLIFERAGSTWLLRGGHLPDYGYNAQSQEQLGELLDALLVGQTQEQSASWPLVMLPTGRPVHAHWTPVGGYMELSDESVCYDQLYDSQQRANKVSLENTTLTRLIDQLMAAKAALEAREQELHRAQAFQRRLLAALAHDIGTPLTSIIGYTEVLGRAARPEPATQPAVQAIQRSARVLKDTTDNLLELARTGQLADRAPEPLDLADLHADIHSMIEPLAAAKRLHFDFQLHARAVQPPLLPPLKVNRILTNLLSNAVRYTTQGGVHAEIRWDGQTLLLVVADTGIGIHQDYHARVFEPLNDGAQFGRKGSGLGLSIVRDLVQSLNGELSMDSAEGRGTRFEVRLPPIAGAQIEPPTSVADDWPLVRLRNTRALVLDDDPMIGDLLTWVLKDAGYAAEPFQDMDAAIRHVRESDTALVISDLELGADSGLAFFERLRLAGYLGVAILMSGHDTPGLRRAARRAGADGYLPKPLNLRRLRQWLARIAPASD